MVNDYELQLKNGISRPLKDIKSDHRQLGPDECNHINEMTAVNGPSQVEYGGDFPYIHVWSGSARPEELPENWVSEDATFEERIEVLVDNLMTFFGNSSTPHNTDASDYDWIVEVYEGDNPVRPDGVHTLQIKWVPNSTKDQ